MLDKHRIRTHNQSIDVLTPEVFEYLLDFLPGNDLVNISQTCRKFKDFVPQYFGLRRCQCCWIKIRIKDGQPKK